MLFAEAAQKLGVIDSVKAALKEAEKDLFKDFFLLFPENDRRNYATEFAQYLIGRKKAFAYKRLPANIGLLVRRQVYEIVRESGLDITKDPRV